MSIWDFAKIERESDWIIKEIASRIIEEVNGSPEACFKIADLLSEYAQRDIDAALSEASSS